MRQTRKAINNLSLHKNIIRKAPIQSGIKHLCTSRAQNDALEATMSLGALALSAYEHPVHRMMRVKQHWAHRSEVRIEKFKAQKKDILMLSVLNLCDSLLSLFF